MAEYEEGEKRRNPTTGQIAEFRGGSWNIVPDDDITLKGSGKAALSGVLHGAVPYTLGLPGDLEDFTTHTLPKLWEKPPVYGKEPVPDQEPGREVVARQPEAKPPVLGSIEAGTAGKLPEERRKTAFPTSTEFKEAISRDIMPEYEPKNFLERGLKTTGEFLPAALIAPESAGASLPARMARSVTRYAAAPAFASEGIKEVPFIKGTAAETPAAIAAALLSPRAATKLITPNAATLEQIRDAATLGGRIGTPGQIAGSSRSRRFEAATADALYGPGSHEINVKNIDKLNALALEKAGITGETKYSPPVRERLNREIDDEFRHLTGGPRAIPWDKDLSTTMEARVADYERSNPLDPSAQPREMLDKIKKVFETAHTDPAIQARMRTAQAQQGTGPALATAMQRGTPGVPASTQGLLPDFIDGQTYQNLRAELGRLAVKADDGQVANVYRDMRNALDTKMEDAIRHFGPPEDLGRFQQVRERYQNKLILDRATKGMGAEAAHHQVTPKRLGAAAEHILGDVAATEAHPMAQLAYAGRRVLDQPLKEQGAKESMMHLASVLAGPGLLGGATGAAIGADTKHDNPYGYLMGGALGGGIGTAGMAALGLLTHSRPGNLYRGNQALPREVQKHPRRFASDATLMAEALAKLHETGRREEPQ